MASEPDDQTEWRRREGPLLAVDPVLARLAREWRVRLTRNYHETPERSLTWRKHGVRRMIQIWPADPPYAGDLTKSPRYRLWIVASQDRWSGRYWKRESVRTDLQLPMPEEEFVRLYEEAYARVSSFQGRDLEPAR